MVGDKHILMIEEMRKAVNLLHQPSDEEIEDAVLLMWASFNRAVHNVIIVDCPISMRIIMDRTFGIDTTALESVLSHESVRKLSCIPPIINDGKWMSRKTHDFFLSARIKLIDKHLFNCLDKDAAGCLYSPRFGDPLMMLDRVLRFDLDLVAGDYQNFSRYQKYQEAKVFGVKYDDPLEIVLRYMKVVPKIALFNHMPIVCRKPVGVGMREGRFHNEAGPAIAFNSGYNLWFVNGIPVDEQVIMRPQTQTLAQLTDERNNDVKAIRIERYGWPRYIRNMEMMPIDERRNDIEGTLEALFETQDGMPYQMVVTCPTGRVFALGVPREIRKCEEAARWLAGFRDKESIIART